MSDRLRTDVLVIGAGPAGSAAALVLARNGVSTTFVDQFTFPRSKTCGDALIPDAISALRRLGLEPQVLRRARSLSRLRVYSADSTCVDLRADLACIARRTFDDILRNAAMEAGARFMAPLRLARPIEAAGQIGGACFIDREARETTRIEARYTLLATGAAAAPLEMFGMCERRAAGGVAVRCYVEVPTAFSAQMDALCISLDERIRPGYGWVFPLPDDIVNLGIGYFDDARRSTARINVRHLWQAFTEHFPLAREVTTRGKAPCVLEGAPLRTGLTGARLSRPGLLVIGEAAGTTYALTGEGIGKALESGIMAANIASACLKHPRSSGGGAEILYARRIREALQPRFVAYTRAQAWLGNARLCNHVAHRARTSAHVRARLEGILNETTPPDEIFSMLGLVRSLFG